MFVQRVLVRERDDAAGTMISYNDKQRRPCHYMAKGGAGEIVLVAAAHESETDGGSAPTNREAP